MDTRARTARDLGLAGLGQLAGSVVDLDLAIGGPYAGMTWWPPRSSPDSWTSRVALAVPSTCPETVEFIGEGIPDPIPPEELFPVEEVMEAALYFYREHRLPEWITWRQWNTKTKQWDTIPATRPAPAGVLAK